MKKQSFILIVILFLVITGIIACESKSPEERLGENNINEESYKILTPCEQINIFSEIGFEFVDVDHAEVLMPGWVYKELQNNSAEINSDCIKRELLRYFSLVEESQNPYFYRDTSLKIHSLFYLSESLGLLRDPEINTLLRATVCEEKIQYSQRFFLIYYFTQKDDLPTYIANSRPEDLPANMEKLRLEICSDS